MNLPEASRTRCDVCSTLSESEYGYSKYDWPEHDIDLANGTEDEQFLTRLTEEEAAEYMR